MLKIPFLRNLLLLVLVIVACMPLYTLLVLHPVYHEQLTHETEQESVRYATYLLRSLKLEGVRLERHLLPVATADLVGLIKDDKRVVKLRFFSPDGEILYSTESEEIGKANTNDYFRNVVAKGLVYSKVVTKDHQTADGVLTKLDLVETYVPFWADERFGGAFEVYYNITDKVIAINALTVRTTMIVVVLALCFLATMVVALIKARQSLEERDKAETALRRMNEDLEERIAGRTSELSQTNECLTAEIADRTRAQGALSHALEDSRRDREKLDGILRSVSDGLVVADHQLAILHMNTAAEKLLDLPLERALGQPLDRLGATAALSGRLRGLLSQARQTASFDFEFPGADPKRPRIFQARFSPMESEQGQPGGVLLIHDVTRERELDRLKSEFLGMAAHELNTPLAIILGFSEILSISGESVQFTPEQQAEYLQLIHGKALELSRLVDDLLDISRVEAGQPLVLDYETLRIDELLRDILRPYQDKCSKHRFELRFSSAWAEIRADHGRIRQVLDNLISNAVKYSPQGGLIKVAVEESGGSFRVSVADEGIGMTAEQVEHIFDRFYRADFSNTAVRGVGLGMSIVRHIIRAHKGDIQVESQLGRGTTVSFDLPAVPPD
jgi:PAS domain S-box-containing protein